MAVIKSISISPSEAEWIDKVDLSLSELVQDAIKEKRRMWEQYNQENAKLIKANSFLQAELGLYSQFLELNGKWEDFRKWRGEQTQT